MLKTIGIVAALYCLALLCSCQKEIDSINETPLDTTDLPATESYIPTTAGTFWVYKDSALDGNDTATVLDETWLYNNVNFKKVHTVGASGEGYSYFGVKDNNYYLYGEQNGITVTMLILNDAVTVGSTWVYDMGMINNLPARGTGTVLEKDISYTVQGKTYQNVIHTQYLMAYNVLGTYITFGTYEFYFAKGVGIIKVKSQITDETGNPVYSTAQDLLDYDVK